MRVYVCLSLEMVIFGVIGPMGGVVGSRLFEAGDGHFWCNSSEGFR